MELSTDTALSQTREPLLDKSNSPPPVPTVGKQVRRKSSFIRRIDSSEECPSPHESIFDAYLLSTTTSNESSNQAEQIQMTPLGQAAEIQDAELTISSAENEPVVQKAGFRYGHGTVLDTISEQKSVATLRTLYRPKSADDVKSIRFMGHRDSLLVTATPRRKWSHSLDDLHLVEYHELCHEIYASPKVPILEPVERPSTPPGMPSWTAAQTPPPAMPRRPYHIPRRPNRLQRFLGLMPSGITLSARVPQPGTERVEPTPVTTPATMGRGQRAPRFRPPRSVYGELSRHPFNNAPIASVPRACSPSKKVRFTPSATARDSAEINLRNAIESTSTLAIHPMAPIHTMAPMVPIPQSGSTAMKGTICTHRKNKKAAATNTGEIIVQTCIDQSSRYNSTSSTTHLMSGALSPQRFPAGSCPTSPVIEGGLISQNFNLNRNTAGDGTLNAKQRSALCWKCVFEKCVQRGGRFWGQATSCLCFVCCGYECDDDSMVYGGYGYDNGSGYFFDQDRRYVLEQTPASMI